MANKIFAGPAGDYPSLAAPLVAATNIGCGFLVERSTTPTAYTLSTTAATVQEQEFLVSVETGETSGIDVNGFVLAGDTLEPIQPKSGQLVQLRFATGNNITALGAPVTTAATAGRFALAAAGNKVFARAQEIKNVTANDTLVLCRVE